MHVPREETPESSQGYLCMCPPEESGNPLAYSLKTWAGARPELHKILSRVEMQIVGGVGSCSLGHHVLPRQKPARSLAPASGAMRSRTRWALAGLCAVVAVFGLLFLGQRSAATVEPIVILIGVDGLRWDYLDKLQPATLASLASAGVRAERMIPCFPSLTFPNFYSLVTGLRPEHHGIIGNSMFDPVWQASFSLGSPAAREGRWWEGEPIWVTAQRQGLRAACMFWPGSEAEIGGMRPWQWRPFDKSVAPADRVQTLLGWLALPPRERPRLMTIYFHEVDTAAHRFGVDAPETVAAVRGVDAAIGQLVAGVKRLGLAGAVNFIVVSDHGMTAVSPDRVVVVSELVKDRKVKIEFSGAVAGLRPAPDEIEEVYSSIAARQNHFRIYRREEVPERLHFRAHRRIPPLILIADEGWMLMARPVLADGAANSFQAATHGFDPDLISMGATFLASGPAFRRELRIAPFENIHVYPLICSILKLTPAPCDGDDRLTNEVLLPAR